MLSISRELYSRFQIVSLLLLPVLLTNREAEAASKKKADPTPKPLSISQMLDAMSSSPCYRDSKAPIELVFLIDRTSKRALSVAPKLIDIVDELQVDYPESRFGLSYYGDFQCTDKYPKEICRKLVSMKKAHSQPEGCYTRGVNLSENTYEILSTVWLVERQAGNDETAGVAGLLLAASDKSLGWTKMTDKGDLDINKIIVIVTDDSTHCCQKISGIRNLPMGDGTDTCATMDNPTPEFTGRKLRKFKISPFLVLANDIEDKTHKIWTAMLERMEVTYGFASMDDNKDEFLKKFKNFIAQVVYNDGPVLCAREKLLEHLEKGRVPMTGMRAKQAAFSGAVTFVNDQSKSLFKLPIKTMEMLTDIINTFPMTRFGISYYTHFFCTKVVPEEKCKKLVPQDSSYKPPIDTERVKHIKSARSQTASRSLHHYKESIELEVKRKGKIKKPKSKLASTSKSKAESTSKLKEESASKSQTESKTKSYGHTRTTGKENQKPKFKTEHGSKSKKDATKLKTDGKKKPSSKSTTKKPKTSKS